MTKKKVLGEQYGITITRPWNDAMYKHNEKVAQIQKKAISKVLKKTYFADDYKTMCIIAKAICGHGFIMMDNADLYNEATISLETAQNFWLHGNVWPDLLKAGLVQPIEIDYVGYNNDELIKK